MMLELITLEWVGNRISFNLIIWMKTFKMLLFPCKIVRGSLPLKSRARKIEQHMERDYRINSVPGMLSNDTF